MESMRHFIAYHKADERGSLNRDDRRSSEAIGTKKPLTFLRQAIGSRVWLIEGRGTTSGESRYSMAYTFIAEKVTAGKRGEEHAVSGRSVAYFDDRRLNESPWFKALKQKVNGFSFGFSEIKDPSLIKGFEAILRRQPIKHEAPTPLRSSSLIEILIAAGLSEVERLTIAALCDGPCSAEGLADRLGFAHYITANGLLGRAGRKVHEVAARGSQVKSWHPSNWGDRGWYHVLAPGRRSEVDGKFYWQVRPAVKRAFEQLGWCTPTKGSRASGTARFDPRMEGAELTRNVSVHERDPSLRRACIALHGHVCSICDVDLGKVYGDLGRGFIHVHHLRPLSKTKTPRPTNPKTDLIPVCPNCHAIIHRGGRLLSPAAVRKALIR